MNKKILKVTMNRACIRNKFLKDRLLENRFACKLKISFCVSLIRNTFTTLHLLLCTCTLIRILLQSEVGKCHRQ